MAQKYVGGREVTCGVLDVQGKCEALEPTEIISANAFFDFDAKYKGASKEVTPPQQMNKETIRNIQTTATKTHKVLGLKGATRVDMILGHDNNLYVLEANTIPGMTERSLLPQGALACGIRFPKLLDLMIQDAIEV